MYTLKEKNIIMEKIYDVTAIVNNNEDVKYLMNMNTKHSPYLTIYNETYLSDKKKAWKLKNEYAAVQTPFIEIKVDGELFKVIYREACEDPLKELVKILNND